MADTPHKNSTIIGFSATVDENGQNMGQNSAVDIANAADLARRLKRDPGGEAETAHLASGHANDDSTDATEAEVPRETIDRISNPTLPRP